MTAEILIVVPVLGRPHRAQLVAESAVTNTTNLFRLIFVCSPGDDAQIEACENLSVFGGIETLVAPWEPGKADWARKIELARHATTEPYLLLGADDISFQPGWDSAVLDVFAEYDVGVVGTNDLANPAVKAGLHSTHPVVGRGYADLYGTIDNPDLMLPDCYWHNWVDTEFVETAKARGCFGFAERAWVPHVHPVWRTAPDDATYRLGQRHYAADAQLFKQRRHLWEKARAAA